MIPIISTEGRLATVAERSGCLPASGSPFTDLNATPRTLGHPRLKWNSPGSDRCGIGDCTIAEATQMVREIASRFTETSWIVTISVLGGVAIAWAIVVGVVSVAKIVVRHRERMAQIGLSAVAQRSSETIPHPKADPSYQGEWPRKSAAG
jgi:hypothetical protein